mmetsp:Transcript_11230/g.24553  ORF Transcript_11230/g.24553 Transcript_11230/m.24553 type:complete len:247 (-) Transcript_11230:471-1211(-)
MCRRDGHSGRHRHCTARAAASPTAACRRKPWPLYAGTRGACAARRACAGFPQSEEADPGSGRPERDLPRRGPLPLYTTPPSKRTGAASREAHQGLCSGGFAAEASCGRPMEWAGRPRGAPSRDRAQVHTHHLRRRAGLRGPSDQGLQGWRYRPLPGRRQDVTVHGLSGRGVSGLCVRTVGCHSVCAARHVQGRGGRLAHKGDRDDGGGYRHHAYAAGDQGRAQGPSRQHASLSPLCESDGRRHTGA